MKFTVSVFLLLICSITVYAQMERQYIRSGNRHYLGATADSSHIDSTAYERAELDFRKAIEADDASFEAKFNLGNALFKQKKLEEATAEFEKLVTTEKDPERLSKSYYNLGNCYLTAQQFDKAIEAYKNALRRNPVDIASKYNLTMAKRFKRMKEQQQQQQQKNQQDKDKQDQIKPSDYAKKLKKQADSLADEGKFGQAADLMHKGLEQDETVAYYQGFIDKLDKVAAIERLGL